MLLLHFFPASCRWYFPPDFSSFSLHRFSLSLRYLSLSLSLSLLSPLAEYALIGSSIRSLAGCYHLMHRQHHPAGLCFLLRVLCYDLPVVPYLITPSDGRPSQCLSPSGDKCNFCCTSANSCFQRIGNATRKTGLERSFGECTPLVMSNVMLKHVSSLKNALFSRLLTLEQEWKNDDVPVGTSSGAAAKVV